MLLRIFGWPMVIAALSLFGLILALIGAGVADWISCVALFAPVLALAWAMGRRRA